MQVHRPQEYFLSSRGTKCRAPFTFVPSYLLPVHATATATVTPQSAESELLLLLLIHMYVVPVPAKVRGTHNEVMSNGHTFMQK